MISLPELTRAERLRQDQAEPPFLTLRDHGIFGEMALIALHESETALLAALVNAPDTADASAVDLLSLNRRLSAVGLRVEDGKLHGTLKVVP